MPRGLTRFHSNGHLHFLTFSCYRRLPKLGAIYDRDVFVAALEEMRMRWRFRVIGYVVMPEHVHLLVSEPMEGSLAIAMQMLKQTSARRLRTTGDEPFWIARYYDFNVWSAEKIEEKVGYMHLNPVRRGLAQSPADWRWSSAGFYAGMESGAVMVEPRAMLVLPSSVSVGPTVQVRAVVVSHPSLRSGWGTRVLWLE
ncbi:MAG: REP-associated tyrosine transposase [Acidobacteriaceae bacterium]